MTEEQGSGRLSDVEVAQMMDLLRRYCAYDLDLWESLQAETPYGPAYIYMTRLLPSWWDPSGVRQF
ncbi:hypothetical protein [Streptomyces sp. NPDC012825]|uniref:hypothetical protein n=1 Tax=Streptomyces sp. NPDC012825 TaxID=3364851 RepID=UPI003683433E